MCFVLHIPGYASSYLSVPFSYSIIRFVRVSDTHGKDDLYQASPTSFKSHSYADINAVRSCFLRQRHYSYKREHLLYTLLSYIYEVPGLSYPM